MIALLAALSLFAPAWAGWESSYKEGKAAYEAGEYGKAIKLFKDAIADKNEEKANAIKSSGMFFESYLPHFYLGMSLFKRKDFKAAVEELNASEAMKVIQKTRDLHQQLRQTRDVAEAAIPSDGQLASQPPPTPTPPPAAETLKETPKEVPKEPAKEVSKPAVPMGPDPALTQAINAAATEIAGAQKLAIDNASYLDEGDRRRIDTAVSEIRSSQTAAIANSRRQELQKTVGDLRSKIATKKKEEEERIAQEKRDQEALQARMAQNKALADAVGRATPDLRDAEKFLSENRTALSPADAQKIQRLFDGTKQSTTADAVTRGAAALKTAVAVARKSLDDRRAASARDAQATYARGVQAYFEGRYDDALAPLQQASSSLPRDAALRAYLGCAFYKKYLLSKGTDPALKQQAEEAFRAAAAADRAFSLDPRYFPPKIVAFYKETVGAR